jgi:hypothetical protein
MRITRNIVFPGLIGLSALAVAGGFSSSNADAAGKAKLLTLTQVGCQFIESEPKDHMFMPKKGSDCEAINKKTGMDRLAKAKPIKLKPGKYII